MKFSVDRSEWYPVIELYEHADGNGRFDLPEDKIEWIRRVFKEFDEVQSYLTQIDKDNPRDPSEMPPLAEAAFKTMEEMFGGKSHEGWKSGDDISQGHPIRWTTIECAECNGQMCYDKMIFRFRCGHCGKRGF